MPPKSIFEDGQNNFIDTINQGPNALDPDLFDGPIDRVMLGLKAHANTISHARLIALEETFPMTREAMGEDIFNDLTREYVELDHVKMHDNSQLGIGFEKFIRPTCAPEIADLAAIEWAWLDSYNAAEAEPLSLEQLSQFDEETLTAQNVALHPAVQIIILQANLAEPLSELSEILDNPHSILVTRPDSEVKLLPIDAITAKLLKESELKTPMGNLLAIATEQGDMNNPLQPLLTIIGAGALICVDT